MKAIWRSLSGLLFSICSMQSISAQRIDNTSSFRQLGQESYFRFHYDNDYFTKTDKYYSQGITLEYVHPSLRKSFLTKLLWKPYKTKPTVGLTFNLFGYTPSTIESDKILYGDRPYNANISLKVFSVQIDPVKQQQISAAFSAGVMGKAALGYDIQTNIHRWLKNPLPHGWEHQIKNDVIFNYQLNYEKRLITKSNYFLLNTTTEARLGTLHTKLNGGLNFMAGRFNNRFETKTKGKQKKEFYFFGQGRVNLVGYDASLQGGLFNRKSPYTIQASDISRINFQADAGIIVNLGKLYLSYTQSYLTKEFKSGTYHRWGGVSVGFSL